MTKGLMTWNNVRLTRMHANVSPLTVLLLLAFLVSPLTSRADMKDARALMKQNQPAKAGEILRDLSSKNPGDPWLVYDQGVAAYAAGDYAGADKIWQDLAATEIPEKLRDKVWTQIGNVSYRAGEQIEKKTPEEALPKWEQSREAYRIVLSSRPKDKMAVHNLKVVELKLARLHAQLAQRLIKEAEKKSLQETIDKLQAALDHQVTAQELDPQNQQYKQDVEKTEETLAEKLADRGKREEQKADNVVKKSRADQWERRQAIENLKNALADFQEAKALNEQNQEANQGEKRVEEKLANLLAQEGRQFQEQGDEEAQNQWAADRAVDNYEKALEKFEEALAMKPEHQDATQGQEEVKAALEKLHVERGDQLAKEGREQVQTPPRGRRRENDERLGTLPGSPGHQSR